MGVSQIARYASGIRYSDLGLHGRGKCYDVPQQAASNEAAARIGCLLLPAAERRWDERSTSSSRAARAGRQQSRH